VEKEEEDRRIRTLRRIVDLGLQLIATDPALSPGEAISVMEHVRMHAMKLFPGKESTFDLIYRPRFLRVIQERWKIEETQC